MKATAICGICGMSQLIPEPVKGKPPIKVLCDGPGRRAYLAMPEAEREFLNDNGRHRALVVNP